MGGVTTVGVPVSVPPFCFDFCHLVALSLLLLLSAVPHETSKTGYSGRQTTRRPLASKKERESEGHAEANLPVVTGPRPSSPPPLTDASFQEGHFIQMMATDGNKEKQYKEVCADAAQRHCA